MFNKNPFAVFIQGQANAVQFPGPGKTIYQTFPCIIDKRNADAKAPKLPFKVDIALKSSIDVFYMSSPCSLHCLLQTPQKVIAKEEFQQFWVKIPDTNSSKMNVNSS